MKESKNHHFNPRSVLRRFTNSDDKLVILNKTSLSFFTNSVSQTGSENYFNTIRLEGERINFEKVFDVNDSIVATLLNKIVDNKSLQVLSDEEIKKLAKIVAVQYVRTKIKRTEAQDLTEKINRHTEKQAELMKGEPVLYPEFNDEESKVITLINLANLEMIENSLLSKDIILQHCTNSQKKFKTSDNPVVLGTSLDYGQIGINEMGIEVYYPISSDYCIVYLCKSIRNKLSLIRGHKNEIDELLNAIETRGVVEVEEKNVNHCNHLQLINSSQFLYSSNDDFEYEIKYLESNTAVKKIKSRIGEVSQKPKRLESLPNGELLVVHTNNQNFKIAIFDVEPSVSFTFSTNELNKFNLLTQDDELKRIIYYKDKEQSNFMNDIEVEKITKNRITIGLRNKGLADVIKKLAEKKRKKTEADKS